jgi:hypothetical protein
MLRAARERLAPVDFDQHGSIAGALFELGEVPDDPLLLRILQKGGGVAAFGVRAAAKSGKREAIYLIFKVWASGTPDVGPVCVQALETLTGQKHGDDVVKWYRWFEANREQLPKQWEEAAR